MHGVSRVLLEQQAQSIGLPLTTVELPEEASMEIYEPIIERKVTELKQEGYSTAAFGDIFLEDLRTYREEQLDKVKMNASFPLWKRDTKELLKEFLDLGFKTIVVCIKSDLLDQSFVGRTIDDSFIEDLPDNVDPCGENGEFHTFCYDGPIFKNPIQFKLGETVYKSYQSPDKEDTDMGFWFCDLITL